MKPSVRGKAQVIFKASIHWGGNKAYTFGVSKSSKKHIHKWLTYKKAIPKVFSN